ncbi:MAG: hypothetical protein JXA95_04850 [Spirochaetales bacterium]|nr:hypothetical protein [Spirochaetales bacterium]
MDYIVLSAMGEDRIGLVEELTERIGRCRCNIEDSRMALLGDEFSIIMLIAGDKEQLDALKEVTGELEQNLNLSVRIKDTRPPVHQKGQSYLLETVSPDSQGLVHQLTSVLKRFDVNIEDFTTEVTPAPWTGTPMFHMRGTIVVPAAADMKELREAFLRLEGEKELDIFLKPC